MVFQVTEKLPIFYNNCDKCNIIF